MVEKPRVQQLADVLRLPRREEVVNLGQLVRNRPQHLLAAHLLGGDGFTGNKLLNSLGVVCVVNLGIQLVLLQDTRDVVLALPVGQVREVGAELLIYYLFFVDFDQIRYVGQPLHLRKFE